MMKHANDNKTFDFVDGVRRQRGRPPTGLAKSAAERQKERRARLAADGRGYLTIELPVDLLAGLDEFVKFKDISKDQVIERLLRQQLLRRR